LRRFSVLASLLLGHSPTSGDASSSRLAGTENRRNKRGRIYEMEYLADHGEGSEEIPVLRHFCDCPDKSRRRESAKAIANRR